MPRTFILIFMLFTTIAGFSQDLPLITVKGIVLNDSTGEPIPYATITLAGKSISTVTNEEGRFIFKFHANATKDSLRAACVGHIPVTIPVHLVDTGLTIIRLKQSYVTLSDVTVRPVNALALVKKAIEKIPENYSTTPYVLNGFYRLTGRKRNSIVHISEGVLQVYNGNYSRETKQFRVVKAREDKDLPAFGGMEDVNVGARPEAIMNDDIVGSIDQTGLLNEEGLDQHVFTYKGIVDYNGQDAYVIDFDMKKGLKKPLYNGTFYLDVSSLAFLQLTAHLSPAGLKYWRFGMEQRESLRLAGVQVRLLMDSGVTIYRKYGDKYYLSHIYGVANWYIASGRKHFELNPLRTKFNYLVTGIDTGDVAVFKKEEIYHASGRIENLATYRNTDSTDAFWGDYNLIQADYNVDSAAKVIRAKNEAFNYRQMLSRQLQKYKKDPLARIDFILSYYYYRGWFNGTALVKYHGKVIYSKGFGMADDSKGMPNTAQTQFRIGAASKQFTAMLIMQLANEGRLSVDDTACRFLPDFRNRHVTIGQLLTDTVMEYTNAGFVVLETIIERLTGKKYADALAERIFIPLGMTHSNGITSTADDLLLWCNALSANILLPKEKMEELFRLMAQWDDQDLKQSRKDTFIILLSNHSDFPRSDITDLILDELN